VLDPYIESLRDGQWRILNLFFRGVKYLGNIY